MTATHTANKLEPHSCRLCGGRISQRFDKVLLDSQLVAYYECEHCHSLQTQYPTWLEEAYSGNLAEIDTGAAQRNLNNLAVVFHLCRLFGLKKVLDFGAGDGLLCRLLRDYRVDARCIDKHVTPTYAKGFEADDCFQPQVVVGFEVVEHFENPAQQLTELFGKAAQVVLISTELYSGQGSDWRYLMPTSGQHVFFYSQKALREYATTQGYIAVFYGRYTLFFHKEFLRKTKLLFLRTLFLKVLLNRYGLQFFKLRMGLIRSSGVETDFRFLVSRQAKTQQIDRK